MYKMIHAKNKMTHKPGQLTNPKRLRNKENRLKPWTKQQEGRKQIPNRAHWTYETPSKFDPLFDFLIQLPWNIFIFNQNELW